MLYFDLEVISCEFDFDLNVISCEFGFDLGIISCEFEANSHGSCKFVGSDL